MHIYMQLFDILAGCYLRLQLYLFLVCLYVLTDRWWVEKWNNISLWSGWLHHWKMGQQTVNGIIIEHGLFNMLKLKHDKMQCNN